MLTRFCAEILNIVGVHLLFIEIVKRGISKARGIDYVKSYLNIDSSNAFGD